MQPLPWPEPADDLAQAIGVMYAGRRAPLAVVVRDELGAVFADAQFVEAFPVRGQPGWSPGRLAMITVLQVVENLTDVQAAEAVRLRLDWKYALGLSLTDRGLDDSVLCEFRSRLVEHGIEARLLDLLVARLVDKGLLKARGKQRTDSTHVLAAVRQLNQIELVGESVRACVEALAVADPDWVTARLDAGWQRRYGTRVDSWRMPASKTKRAVLGADYARDAVALLRAVWDPGAPPGLAHLSMVGVLQRVLIQNVMITTDRGGREVIRLREADTDGLPPGRCRIVSPYDTDARWGGKRDLTWYGYKLHISESCDAEPPAGPAGQVPDSPPNLITNAATTDASVPDAAMTEPIHHDLARRELLPAEHYLDSGYPSADLLVSSLTDFGVRLITPMLADTSPQARAGEGFDRGGFTPDWQAQTLTCPQGQTSASWTPAAQRGTEVIVVKFAGETCQACPVKAKCTTAGRGGRQLTLRPQPVQEALDTARAAQTTKDWQRRYARRAGIEATIAQATKVTDIRRARYRGLPKTRLEHTIMAAALNLIRLDAWFNGETLDPRRTSHLSRLDLALAA
ncbi:MAG TPA: IS1182 family transposase [Mycobacterium sp.]